MAANESEAGPMRIRASRATYCLVCVREQGPRLGNLVEDVAVGQTRVRGLDVFTDVVLVEEIGRGRAFGCVWVLGFLFFRLTLAFFALAVEGAFVGSGAIVLIAALLGTTGLA